MSKRSIYHNPNPSASTVSLGPITVVKSPAPVTPLAPPPNPSAPFTVTPDMFLQDTVTQLDGSVTTEPLYTCASSKGVTAMQVWLLAQGVSTTVVFGSPINAPIGDPVQAAFSVPYLESPQYPGARENCGMLLQAMQQYGGSMTSLLLMTTVGAFAIDSKLASTDPSNQGLQGNTN